MLFFPKHTSFPLLEKCTGKSIFILSSLIFVGTFIGSSKNFTQKQAAVDILMVSQFYFSFVKNAVFHPLRYQKFAILYLMSIIKMRYDKYKVQAQLFNAFSFIFRTNWAKEVYNETTFILINSVSVISDAMIQRPLQTCMN